jgi:hypothetical protein
MHSLPRLTWHRHAVVALTPGPQIGEQGVVQLPAILRIMKQPCARNECYSRVYPLRPFPLCTVPAATEVSLLVLPASLGALTCSSSWLKHQPSLQLCRALVAML